MKTRKGMYLRAAVAAAMITATLVAVTSNHSDDTKPVSASTDFKSAPSSRTVKPFDVRLPKVSAEVPISVDDAPFSAWGFNKSFPLPTGYEVREYFLTGKGNIYEFNKSGVQVVAPCPEIVTGKVLESCSDLPYTTRMLVLRPKSKSAFSGNVWVNPMNPSIGWDAGIVWNRQADYFARQGDVVVEYTSKSVAAQFLKQQDPERYSPIFWPSRESTGKPFTGGDQDAAYDGITFDIAAQVGALVKANPRQSPIHDLDVKHVFETGFSQDGIFVYSQAAVFHELLRTDGGKRIFDGYLPQGAGGIWTINMGLTKAGVLAAGDPREVMGPRDAAVIKLNTETEIAGNNFGPITWRRPDSDGPEDRYRTWEVGGASHDDVQTIHDPTFPILIGADSYQVDCKHTRPPASPSGMPFNYVANAASHALVEWVVDGTPPPRVSPLEQTNLAEPTKKSMRRDKYGNALGGVRTPYLDVPIDHYGVLDTGGDFCWTFGWQERLHSSALRALYPMPGDYQRKFRAAAFKAVSEGVWLREDADEAIRAAENHAP